MIPEEWTLDAACAQVYPDLFFPEKGANTRDAKSVCNGDAKKDMPACPVRAQCLAAALASGERFGIWGGVSERQRRTLIKASAA